MCVQVSVRSLTFLVRIDKTDMSESAYEQIHAMLLYLGTPRNIDITGLGWESFFLGHSFPKDLRQLQAAPAKPMWSPIPLVDQMIGAVFVYRPSRRSSAAAMRRIWKKSLAR